MRSRLSAATINVSLGLLAELLTITNDSTVLVPNHNLYQFIRENIDEKSKRIPRLLVMFYSKGTDEEIAYLKSLNLDLKTRDENGNTVLHLATVQAKELGDKCITRIREELKHSVTLKFLDLGALRNNDGKTYVELKYNNNNL